MQHNTERRAEEGKKAEKREAESFGDRRPDLGDNGAVGVLLARRSLRRAIQIRVRDVCL